MANQRDFNLFGQSFDTISRHSMLFQDIPPLNNRMEFQVLQAELRTEFQQFRAEIGGLVNGMNARLNETNTRLGRMEVNLAETNTRLGRMEVSLAETNTRLDGTNERLVRMKVSLAKTNPRLDGKNERFGRMEVSLNGTNALLGGMDKRFDRMDERIEANNHNSIARTLNSTVTRVDARLSPLRNTNNKVIAYFPESPNAVKKLNGSQINRLLRAFELTEDGSLILRRTRLIEFIGNCLL